MKKQKIMKRMGGQKISKKERQRIAEQNAENEYVLKWMGIWILILAAIGFIIYLLI